MQAVAELLAEACVAHAQPRAAGARRSGRVDRRAAPSADGAGARRKPRRVSRAQPGAELAGQRDVGRLLAPALEARRKFANASTESCKSITPHRDTIRSRLPRLERVSARSAVRDAGRSARRSVSRASSEACGSSAARFPAPERDPVHLHDAQAVVGASRHHRKAVLIDPRRNSVEGTDFVGCLVFGSLRSHRHDRWRQKQVSLGSPCTVAVVAPDLKCSLDSKALRTSRRTGHRRRARPRDRFQ